MRFFKLLPILLSSVAMLTCSKGGSGVGSLLCQLATASYDTSSLTVGLGSLFIDAIRNRAGQNLMTATEDETNQLMMSTINDGIKAARLDEYINIKSVKSVAQGAEDDGIRFFELDGKLAGASTLASKLLSNDGLQEALANSLGLVDGERVFTYLEDSFRVRPAVTSVVESSALGLIAADNVNEKQWAYSQTEFSAAVSTLKTLTDVRKEVVVAVIDTGVDLDHPALENVLLTKDGKVVGYNFVNDSENPDDDQGHGTHCAGIIAAEKKGDDGMIGVAQAAIPGKVKIMAIKVLGGDGSGSTANINKGIRWAINHGADVISMSLGGAVSFADLQKGEGAESKVIRDAVDRGVIMVVAAGNENCPLGGTCEQRTLGVLANDIEQYTVLPCSYNGTVCIGASDPDVTVAEYSNYPSKEENGVDPKSEDRKSLRASPDVVAPGTAIYSTYPGGEYKVLSGTSMATPYVAGLAAIYKMKATSEVEKRDGTSQRTFWKLLQASAASLEEENGDTRSFVGQVDFSFYAQRLSDLISGKSTAVMPKLKKVEGPEAGTDYDAPNLVSLMCGD